MHHDSDVVLLPCGWPSTPSRRANEAGHMLTRQMPSKIRPRRRHLRAALQRVSRIKAVMSEQRPHFGVYQRVDFAIRGKGKGRIFRHRFSQNSCVRLLVRLARRRKRFGVTSMEKSTAVTLKQLQDEAASGS